MLYRSADGGRTWSYARELTVSPAFRFRLQTKLDVEDTVYVLWDEVDAEGNVVSSALVHSSDRGDSWSAPVHFPDARGASAQATMSVDGQGSLAVVWRSHNDDHIYYQLSPDGGTTWSTASAIEGILARSQIFNDSGFDRYDIAPDSAGNLHLVVVGRTSMLDDPPGLYLLEWDGTAWSAPSLLYAEPDRFPEYPSITVGVGNKLHAVWFVRDREHFWLTHNPRYEVWYAQGVSTAPHVARPTPSPALTAPTPTALPMASVSPTPVPQYGADEESSWRDISPYPVQAAVAPVALLLLGLLIARSRVRLR